MQLKDIESLGQAERILLVQDLWNSVLDSAESLPLNPAEHHWLGERVAYAQRLDAEWFSFEQITAARSARR